MSAFVQGENRAVAGLGTLYSQYGYVPYKMSKFEEYDLYVQNKDFLVSDRIITFNDTNGKLMALKPDVTLSIVKNGEDIKGVKQKVYYNENVYRISGSTHQYKEIMQTGLECIGDIDAYDIFEVVFLAGKSLQTISPDFVLDISHLGVLTSVFNSIGANQRLRREIFECIAKKNRHDIASVCERYGVTTDVAELFATLASLYGAPKDVLKKLAPLCRSDEARAAYEELASLSALLEGTDLKDRVRFDFSIVSDSNYYNGIVFKGFLNGICEGVLSGGQYDNLLHRMGRKAGAVGFALYLDLLEELNTVKSGYDVDMLLLYDEKTDMEAIIRKSRELTDSKKCVSVQKAIPPKMRYREILDLRGKKND